MPRTYKNQSKVKQIQAAQLGSKERETCVLPCSAVWAGKDALWQGLATDTQSPTYHHTVQCSGTEHR